MVDVENRVRERAINDVWTSLGRVPGDSTDTVVWPHQEEMRLPFPLYFEEEEVSLADAASENFDLINVQYLGRQQSRTGLRAVTAFDLNDEFYYVVEHGNGEPILHAVVPKTNARETFTEIQRKWIIEHITEADQPFPARFDALDHDATWLRRRLTEALVYRGEEGYERAWDLVTAERRIDAIDDDAVVAFFHQSVDISTNGKGSNRTGQIPGLIADTPISPEFDSWLEGVELQWSDNKEPLLWEHGRALRIICYYLAAPPAFYELGRE
jgi:hypothetical protein